ncbi:MAG: hypothetical protein AAF698_09800, partial [Pseudomonadota bacterium]
MTREWTEEEIAAYVDGQIDDPAEAAIVARAIAEDPEAARLAEELGAINRALAEAYDAPMTEPIPPRIAETLNPAPIPLRPRSRRLSSSGPLPMALAASLALAVGLAGGLLAPLGPTQPADDGVQLVLGPHSMADPLGAALEATPSGEVSGAVRPLFSFLDADQRPCREFETAAGTGASGSTGIACRTEQGVWSVRILVATTAQDIASVDGFVTASGAAEDALSVTLDALGA